MKPVILIIVDALTARVVVPAIERGELPTLAALARAGALHPGCVSMFPSITPAATATLLTGCYPSRHGIAGASWHDEEQGRVIYYSTDVWTILREGLADFVEDFLYQLNHRRLQTTTLFERVERAGMRAASLNNLLYRGDVAHKLRAPLLLRLLPGMPSTKTVAGPTGLLLGDFAARGLDGGGEVPRDARGIMHRFGFDDEHTAEVLLHLARTDTLPELTVAYFPDNDFESHQVGPVEALACVRKVDGYLGDLAAALGGVEGLLERYCLLVTGDHSHCDILKGDEAGITLDELLPEHTVADHGAQWGDDDDLMVCLNLRAAQIYLRRPTPDEAERVAAALLADERIDQVFWRPCDLGSDDPGYVVLTRDRGRLRFWPGAGGDQTAPDAYGQPWSWAGDLTAVDGRRDEAGRLSFPDYPNAFERVAAGLDHEGAGPLWVTARPGYSLHLRSTMSREIHAGGGSHGALHACDSLVPLLLAGAPPGVAMPAHPRTVDVAPLCLAALGLTPDPPAGASRVEATSDQGP
ncbi:MAG TPA: alkaline phosphatase family protein [Chloroflexaceae bacterium]|nr:alkaline phosphatase family protein [Chloroflexaceae bacterium]